MKMATAPTYLARHSLDHHDVRASRIHVSKNLPEIISNWTLTTRVSPIWGISSEEGLDPDHALPTENGHICLLCRVSPLLLKDELPDLCEAAQIYIGLGLFNLIVGVKESQSAQNVEEWCNQKGFAWETWQVTDGQVLKETRSNPRKTEYTWKSQLPEENYASAHGSLAFSLREHVTLMAQAQARCRQATPDLLHLFQSVDGYITWKLKELFKSQSEKKEDSTERASHAQAILVSTNSGLSRLTSHAYSGSTPASLTGSDYWYHSLFGIGSANIALYQLTRFVGDILGQIDIPELLAFCGTITDKEISCLGLGHTQIPNLDDAVYDDKIFISDNLQALKEHARKKSKDLQENRRMVAIGHGSSLSSDHSEPSQQDVPIYPITFFSGRDGFRSHLMNLSAPLNSVGGCNSLKWSLLTITHEICHSFLNPIMAYIYPNPSHCSLQSKSLGILLACKKPDNLLDALRQRMLRAINAINMAARNPHDPNMGQNINRDTPNEQILLMAANWHRRIEELLVHLLDYLYFYRSKPKEYIHGIWSTWSMIPQVGDRVDDYVLRTMTAVLSDYCFTNEPEGAMNSTRDVVVTHLQELKNEEFLKNHQALLNKAIVYIEKEWNPKIRNQLIASSPLVGLTRGFLFSQSALSTMSTQDQVVSLTRGVITELKVQSPLDFVREYQKKEPAQERESTWLLSILSLFHKLSTTPSGGTCPPT